MSGDGYGYGGYGYGDEAQGHGAAAYAAGGYEVRAGGYIQPANYLSGPGSSFYYAYYSGSTKFVDYAYENAYGGKSTYEATLSPTGDFIQTSYGYFSSDRSVSESTTYSSHAAPVEAAYAGYGYHDASAVYGSTDISTHTSGSYEYLQTVTSQSKAYFDGSFGSSYSDTTSIRDDGMTIPGSTHTYSLSSYTYAGGYSTYHSSQT